MHQWLKIECDECDYTDEARLNVRSLLNEDELAAMKQFLLLHHKKRDH